MNKKPCKTCNEKKRYANLSICYTCYRTREKKKKEEKALKKKLRKESTKKFQNSLKKTLMNKAWKLMSEWTRKRDKGECYTCGKRDDLSSMHAGHRHHGKLNFDERNIHTQCAGCNTYLHGNLGIYERRLIQELGIEGAKQLEADAWEKGNNYSVEELGEIMKDLTNKIKELDYENKNI